MNLFLSQGKKYPNQLCGLCGPHSGVTEETVQFAFSITVSPLLGPQLSRHIET
jgi:hypothetical protein